MDLGRKVAVQRAHRHVGAVGDRAHLHRLVTALGGDRHGGIQDALAALPLRVGAEFGFGEDGHRHDLTRL